MKWESIDQLDQIAFEQDFGSELPERINGCDDERNLEILIDLAKARLNELKSPSPLEQ